MVSTDLFERPRSGERAVIVHMTVDGQVWPGGLEEFRSLALSAGATPVATVTGSRRAPDPRHYVGAGKAEEIRGWCEAENAEVILLDHELTPSQERNLEKLLNCRVLDRTGLILDIFAQRAHSFEGKLQVELAQLQHLSTRLVRGWSHLERQKGGIGLRGPGETQLESDRRLIGKRIKTLKARLEKVTRQRGQGRRARSRAGVPTVSLVGYTNAGKSTLFNRLTESGVYAADQLFATLDPTLRRVELPGGEAAVLADTVGFIRRLPHDLIAAFRSTLEETVQASLLLHVIDAGDTQREEAIDQVNEVLAHIGADQVPQIAVYNKIDALGDGEPRVERDAEGAVRSVWLSARTGLGIDSLVEALREYFGRSAIRRRVCLPPHAGRLRARLYELGRVLTETTDDAGSWVMDVELPQAGVERLLRDEGLCDEWLKGIPSP